MDNSMKIGLVKVTLFSILLALSGMAAIASADFVTPIMFYGNATLNDEPATTGMVINAYINEEPSGTSIITDDGQYHINVRGNESDEGELITFEICGATADQTDTWHASANGETRPLNLTAVDDEAPAVENANANPTSIVANGTDPTRLNVTVIDGCRCTVGTVTVNLSDIGGSDAQEMSRIGDTDVYTVTVNATEGTPADTYCLQVNASDVFGKCNTSVYIPLEVTNVTSVQFTIHLEAGWNMVSIPAVLDDPSVGTVFPTKVGSVWGWNTTTQGYESVSTLEPTKGYWVLVTSSTTIPLSGSSPSSTLLLETGWNLIGILGLDDVPESDIPEHIGSVWGWNATIQGYESASILEPTEGYWVLGHETSGSP